MVKHNGVKMSNDYRGKKLCTKFFINTIQHLGIPPEWLKTHQIHSSFCDCFKIMAADKGCYHTDVLHFSKVGHSYIYPGISQNWSLTPREAARLQTFPDDYFFESVLEEPWCTAAYHQIGNSVPVLLSQKIADKLHEVL